MVRAPNYGFPKSGLRFTLLPYLYDIIYLYFRILDYTS